MKDNKDENSNTNIRRIKKVNLGLNKNLSNEIEKMELDPNQLIKEHDIEKLKEIEITTHARLNLFTDKSDTPFSPKPPVIVIPQIYDENLKLLFTDGPTPEDIVSQSKECDEGTLIGKYFWGETMYLKIDLSYDKKLIIQQLDDFITFAQKKICNYLHTGKRKRAKRIEFEKLIETLLIKYFVENNYPQKKSLEKISEELFNNGITIQTDSIERRYLPSIKKKYGIKNIKELRGVIKGMTDR